MPNNRGTALKLIGVRAIRLDENNAIDAGSNNQVVLRAPVQVTYTPNNPDQESFEQLDGDGNQCVSYQGPPKPPDFHDLTMQLCQNDFELIELLVGGSIITGDDGTIGWLEPTDDTINANGVVFEGWQRVQSGNQPLQIAGVTQFLRHLWPKATWQVSDQVTLENGLTVISLSGKGVPNSAIGTGLDEDPFPVAIGDSVHGEAYVDSVPADTGGYAAVTDIGS